MSKDAKFVVRLAEEERFELQAMVDDGRGAKGVRRRARVLLKADESESDRLGRTCGRPSSPRSV